MPSSRENYSGFVLYWTREIARKEAKEQESYSHKYLPLQNVVNNNHLTLFLLFDMLCLYIKPYELEIPMAFDFLKFFSRGAKLDETLGAKTLIIKTHRCPQNHRCPSVEACPFGALSQKGNRAPVIDYDKCTGCGKCTRYCMPRALVMQRGK